MKILLLWIEAAGFAGMLFSAIALRTLKQRVLRTLAKEGVYEFGHAFWPTGKIIDLVSDNVDRSQKKVRAGLIYLAMALSVTTVTASIIIQKTIGRQ